MILSYIHWKRISPRNNFQGENILFRSRMVLSFILAGIRTASECFRWPLRPKEAKNKNTKNLQEMNFPGKNFPRERNGK